MIGFWNVIEAFITVVATPVCVFVLMFCVGFT